jgi:hypothetical protein
MNLIASASPTEWKNHKFVLCCHIVARSGNTAANILGARKILCHVLLTTPVFGGVCMRVDGYLPRLINTIRKENQAHAKEINQVANPC